MTKQTIENLILVSRADPIICGHSTETRNLAEASLKLGVKKVDIVTWPEYLLKENKDIPLKSTTAPYSEGITVHRPDPVGNYKILDGRFSHGMVGRIVDLVRDNQGKTAIMDLYLTPHSSLVSQAARILSKKQRKEVVTIGEAVGSDITNIVRNAVNEKTYGSAQMVFHDYLEHDVLLAVSEYTKKEIVHYAGHIDRATGTDYVNQLEKRINVSYPAIDLNKYAELDKNKTPAVLAERNLQDDQYLLFLSRITNAKGVDDLISGYKNSKFYGEKKLVIAGQGPARQRMMDFAGNDENIVFYDDISDDEKPHLMDGAYVFIFPTKPQPEFVETLGIVLVEYSLVGRRPLITCPTGGVPEATGGNCFYVNHGDSASITGVLDSLPSMTNEKLQGMLTRAREYGVKTFNSNNIMSKILMHGNNYFTKND